MHFGLLAGVVLFVLIPTVAANDTAAKLGAGGLVAAKSSAIAIDSEDLRVTSHQVSVKYVFRNLTSRDVDLVIAFPLPEIDGGAVANVPINVPSRDPLNFVDFQVLVDGKRVVPRSEVRSFLHGMEITRELRSLGVPLSVLDQEITTAVNRLPPADQARLKQRQWVDCSLTSDQKCWPQWQTRVKFYWTQHFPAKAVVGVEHTYHPVVGGSLLKIGTADYRDWDRKDFCPAEDALAQLKREADLVKAKAPMGVVRREKEIQYILTTANNWSGPIRDFRLSVITDQAADIVSSCMPGLERAGPTEYRLLRSNFHPDRELELILLEVAR
jgi:hypothetical protein